VVSAHPEDARPEDFDDDAADTLEPESGDDAGEPEVTADETIAAAEGPAAEGAPAPSARTRSRRRRGRRGVASGNGVDETPHAAAEETETVSEPEAWLPDAAPERNEPEVVPMTAMEHAPPPEPQEEPLSGPDVGHEEQAAPEQPETPAEDQERKTEVAYTPDTAAEPPAVSAEEQRQKKSGWWNRSW
jgi:hypothetical protein